MAESSTLLNRALIVGVDAAVVAAGLDFAAFNLQNIGGGYIYIDGIEIVVNASAADFANLVNIQSNITKNLTLNTTVALGLQTASGLLMWQGRTRTPTDRRFKTRFVNGGFKLAPDSAYNIVGFAAFNAVLGGIISLTMSVIGRYEEEEAGKRGQLYGGVR